MPSENKEQVLMETLNKQIVELKKKIQLSEGQRKAHYEECDAEKKRNVEVIAELKKTVKELHEELGRTPSCDESILKKSQKYPKEVMVLKHKSSEDAVQILDDKVINLNKKVDLIHDYNKQRQHRMKQLVREHEELTYKKEMELATKRTFHGTNQIISSLENRTHQISMSMMEAEHLRKKYKSIRAGLMQDSVEFESTLDRLEQDLCKQEAEIANLTRLNEEALALRDSTRTLLSKQEQSAVATSRQRERQIQDLRFYVEERKTELEKLERRILPSGRPSSQTECIPAESAQNQEQLAKTEFLENTFTKLKEATGVTQSEEVLQRYLSQQDTKTRLLYLKESTEQEKQSLEHDREMMAAELEVFKFVEVKDKEQNEEEMEAVKQRIEEEVKRKAVVSNEADVARDQLSAILRSVHKFCFLLKDIDSATVPTECPGVEKFDWLLCLLKTKLESVSSKASKRQEEQPVLDETLFRADLMGADHTAMWILGQVDICPPPLADTKNKNAQVEEDEVPTRAFLKRQAQVIVDTKSRRKGFSRVAMPSRLPAKK